MATTLYQAVASFPGKVYAAFGQVVDTISGRRAEREQERNQKELVDFFQEKLVSAFRAGRVRLLPYYDNLTAETAEHRLAYRWLLKEPAIKSAFMSKLLSVMSLDLQVDPASESPRDKEISTFVEDALRRCHGGPAEIIWSILFGALLEGNGLSEKVFGKVDRGKYRGRPSIRAIKSKDSHDYQIEIDEFNNPTVVRSRRTAEEFPMSDFCFWSHMPGFSNPAGMSDLRAVYRAGWMLDTVWKLRAIGLERFTLPIFMSKYPMGRNDIRDSINDAVKKAKSLGYLTVPQEAAVEAIEMASKSGSDFDAAIKGLQEECFIGIQGATLQAMAGSVPDGSGKSSVHKSTTELFVWYLSVAAATVINDQVIPDLVDLNYADADYPTSWLGGINDSDLKAALEIDLGLLQLGLVQDPQDLARRYRRQMAKNPQQALETLKLIKSMGMQQPPPGGGMGGAMVGLPGDGGGNGGAVPFDEAFADDGLYHGQNPPAGWVQVGTGPKGGKIWGPSESGDKSTALVPSQPVKKPPVVAEDGVEYPAEAVTQDKAGNHFIRIPAGSGPVKSPVTGATYKPGALMPIRRSDAFHKQAKANDAKLFPGKADAVDTTHQVNEKPKALAGMDDDEPEKFTDDDQPPAPPDGPAPISDQTAVTPDSHRVEQLLSVAQSEGSKFLGDLARKAISRYVTGGQTHLLSNVERQALAGKLAEAISAADLLGRSRVRLRAQQIASGPIAKFADEPTNWGPVSVPAINLDPPMEALKYFKSLVPAINVEPLQWLKDIEARAFTLSVATETQLLEKVQAEIASRMTSGEYGWGPQAVQDLLNSAGVAPENPQYCFLPGTLVEGDVVAISKANYDGPAVEIETNDGRVLRVSVNHPILTTSGWKVAGEVDEGDDLICYGDPVESLCTSRALNGGSEISFLRTDLSFESTPSKRRAINNQEAPARVEDVFESLLGQSGTILDAQRPIRPLDFHGDATFMDGKIDRIRANWMLQRVADPKFDESLMEFGFMFGDVPPSPLSSMRRRLPHSTLDASLNSALVTDELSKDTVLVRRRSACPPSLHRIGMAAKLDPSIFKALAKTPGGDAYLAGNLVRSLTGIVTTNSVLKVKRFRWTGHVYDLQTVHGFIVSQGIVTSNCEMVFRTNVKDALAKGSHEELQDPDVLPQFPVWKYSAVGGPNGDGRNRPTHLAKHGNYYPSTVPFTKVRGEGPVDACNDRCDFIAIDKYDWEELQSKGAKIAAGY